MLGSGAACHARRSDGRFEIRVRRGGKCDRCTGFTRFHCGCGRCFAGRRRTRNWTTSWANTSNEKPRNTLQKGWHRRRHGGGRGLDLGSVEKVKEESRDARSVNWIQDFVQDLHYGVRAVRKSSGFASVAILTLGLGIGASTSVFSV